jgi:hypothetical protein
VNWSTLISWGLWAAKWALTATAAGNVARLNTPDTAAGPMDWLLYVGLPALAAPAAAAGEWLANPLPVGRVAGADLDPAARDRRDVGLVIGRMVADGKHDAAAALIAALKQGGKS